MSDPDGAEPKVSPLRVPVIDVPVRHSILAPDNETGAAPEPEAPRPSVIPSPVRVVSGPPPAAASSEADAAEDEHELDMDVDDPLELTPMEASVEAAVEAASMPAQASADYEDSVSVETNVSIDPAETLELDPDEEAEPLEAPRPSMAQPPPPPAGVSHPPAAVPAEPARPSAAQPPPPPASVSNPPARASGRPTRATIDIDVTEDEDAHAVVIDLAGDEPDAASATAVAPVDEPMSGPVRRSNSAPPPPPNSRGPSGAAHRVADLKPSKPRKQHWWESFFNDDYLRSVRVPGREAVARKADFIEHRLGLSPGATVLDVGCGWGADVVELSTRGYLGVGLDLSLAMLSRAADEAQERGQRINFLHADMREMNFDGTFDAVMCLGTSFGYFDDDTNRQVVGRLRRALKPQGVLLLETVNRDHVIRYQPNLVWFEGDGCVCMEESEFNYFTSRLHVKRTVILDDGRQRENEYSVRLYSLHELGQMLHHQGFRVTEVSGRMSVPGVFFGQESPALLVVAERRVDGTGKHSIPPLEDAFEEDD